MDETKRNLESFDDSVRARDAPECARLLMAC